MPTCALDAVIFLYVHYTMPKTIILTGGTGFIGSRVARMLAERGDRVILFARHPDRARQLLPQAQRTVLWAPGLSGAWRGECRDADAIVHLAGEPIAGKRWTPAYKQRILDSRVLGTRSLVEALRDGAAAPHAFVCASAVGWYGDRGDEELDEASAPGADFLASVCAAWEREASAAAQAGARVVCARIGIVLAAGAGALPRMLLPFRLHAGALMGHGRQWMSWIHIDDLARLIVHALDTPGLGGAMNAVAPEPLRHAAFSAAIGIALRRRLWLRVPRLVLRCALGEFADAMLASQRVLPRAALASGFHFRFATASAALADIAGSGETREAGLLPR
jgi:hypothetical protein